MYPVDGRAPSPIGLRTNLNLDLNENTAGCSPRVLSNCSRSTADDLSRYPQRESGEKLIADFLGMQPQNLLLTNGIDEALQLIFGTYLDQQDELLLAEPTFSMYRIYGQATGAM